MAQSRRSFLRFLCTLPLAQRARVGGVITAVDADARRWAAVRVRLALAPTARAG